MREPQETLTHNLTEVLVWNLSWLTILHRKVILFCSSEIRQFVCTDSRRRAVYKTWIQDFWALIHLFEMYCQQCASVCMRLCVQRKSEPMVRYIDRGTSEAALVRGRRVITIMRMDVFIMSCVSYSNSFLPIFFHPSFLPWLTWVPPHPTSGRLGPHLDAPASLASRGRLVGMCYPFLPAALTAIPSTFEAKASCWFGGLMGCGIWAREKRATPRFSAFSDRAPSNAPPSPLLLHSHTLFFSCFFSLPCLRGRGERNPIFRAPSFTHPCAHLSICPSTSESQSSRFPPQVIASLED